MSLETDRQLLDAFRRGERQALERVYQLYVDKVARCLRHGFAFQSAGNTLRFAGTTSQFQLEDWTHDVFVRAFSESARAQYDGLRPYGPYLERIARNLVLDELRRKEHKVREHVEVLPEPAADPGVDVGPSAPPNPERQLEERQLTEHVADFLKSLPRRERQVYELRFVEGLDQKEVARRADLSPSKVKTSEKRIREGFVEYLGRKGWFDDHRPDEQEDELEYAAMENNNAR